MDDTQTLDLFTPDNGDEAAPIEQHASHAYLGYAVSTVKARALPEIAEAVGEKATVLLDSGVRRGSDIAKALALGAKAVLIGRATLYGTAVGGQAGAGKAISVLRKELDNTMVYCGCNTVDEITRDILFGPRAANTAAALVG